MFEMKVQDGQPYLRNGSYVWSKPVVDEKGTFYPSQQTACKKLDLSQAAVSHSVVNGAEVSGGKKFRFARLSEVQEHLGDKVQMVDGGKRKKKPAKKSARSAKSAKSAKNAKSAKSKKTTIEVRGRLKPLKRDGKLIFEGHEFTGGPAVVMLPGYPEWSMTLASKDEFPPAIRDHCKWS
jgi:hypothetical protein